MLRVTLTPVDGVHITTLMDNSSDELLPDGVWSGGGASAGQRLHCL